LADSIRDIERSIISLLPEEGYRYQCLMLFLEALFEADNFGVNKWGVQYVASLDRLRLLVGSIIVLTIHKQGIWVTLDRELLQESKEDLALLNRSENWLWDDGQWAEYEKVPSRNGFYKPFRNDEQIWPVVRRLHFHYIARVANKYSQLRADSQRLHMPEVLEYLRLVLDRYVPEPDYAEPVTLSQEMEKYQAARQYKALPETERELLTQQRIGQGQFREKLKRYWRGCAVTNCQAVDILRASHIKPWRVSNNEERLDLYNGLLLVPNLDAAFDKGLVSFTNEGEIMISPRLSKNDQERLNIHLDLRLARLEEQHLKYMKYHREHVFQKE
jgi:putative restriction endonuclease